MSFLVNKTNINDTFKLPVDKKKPLQEVDSYNVDLSGHNLTVVIGPEARLTREAYITYIQSGQKELEPLVIRAEDAAERAEKASIITSYTHTQAEASSEWYIQHNLGRRPHITVIDSAGTTVSYVAEYIDDNTVIIRFNNQFKGTAYLH